MAKELTQEALAEVFKKKGLTAAMEMVATKRENIKAAINKQEGIQKKAVAEVDRLNKELSKIDTLLSGAIKSATAEVGLRLSEPATKPKGLFPPKKKGGRGRASTADKQTVLAEVSAFLKEKGEAKKKDIKAHLDAKEVEYPSVATFNNWLTEICTTTGQKAGMKYSLK